MKRATERNLLGGNWKQTQVSNVWEKEDLFVDFNERSVNGKTPIMKKNSFEIVDWMHKD